MSQVQQVKEAVNIIDVIGNRVALQRSGNSFKGLCPFHGEKSPSFFVSENMQRYKCFGCGKTGDVFTFLEDYEGMTFREALETMAEAANIQLKDTPVNSDDQERTKLLEVLDLAKSYYHFLLTKHHVGERAREYLRGRGVNQDSIRLYQIGYSLPAWDGLTTYLHDKKKYDYDLLIKAGLASSGNGGRVYDRFRSRIMFPLRNHRGQIVGFSGRILEATDNETPKYINSPETLLYHKSQMLFGFHENLQAIRKERKVVVVEGEFDVISSGEAHVDAVVAIKGSALTIDHVKLLSRSVDQIILSLDADDAGIAATKKAIAVIKAGETSREQPLTLSVLRIPEGKDPDELSKNDPKRWRELVKRPITAYEFLIQAACEKFDPTLPEGKMQIMADLMPILAGIDHAVQFEYYTKVLADKMDASISSVQSDIKKYQRSDSNDRSVVALRASSRTGEKSEEKEEPTSKQKELESYLLFLLFNAKPDRRTIWVEKLARISLETTSLQIVFSELGKSDQDLGKVLSSLPDDVQQMVFEFATNPKYYALLEKLDLAKEWPAKFKELQIMISREEGTRIEEELESLDRMATKTPEQEERQDELLNRLVTLKQKVKTT